MANGLRVLAVSLALVLFFLTLRVGWQASYRYGDVPKEMLVYAHASGDVPQIAEEVKAVAQSTGLREDLPITVDADMSTVFRWYLRDFKNVVYTDLSTMTQPPEGRVLLINEGNTYRLRGYMDRYAPARDFLYLYWPAEGYKPCGPKRGEPCLKTGEVFSNLFSRAEWREGLDFYLYRKNNISFLLHKGVAYFSKES